MIKMISLVFVSIFMISCGSKLVVGPVNIQDLYVDTEQVFHVSVPNKAVGKSEVCGIFYAHTYDIYYTGTHYDIIGTNIDLKDNILTITKAEGIKYFEGNYAIAKTEYEYDLIKEETNTHCNLIIAPKRGISHDYKYEREIGGAPHFSHREANAIITNPYISFKFEFISKTSPTEVDKKLKKNLVQYNIPNTFYVHENSDSDNITYYYISNKEQSKGMIKVRLEEEFRKTHIIVYVKYFHVDINIPVDNQISELENYILNIISN